MHPQTLTAAGAILILSNLVSLARFPRRTPKSSPMSLIFISDVASSAFTAITLFLYQFYINHPGFEDYTKSSFATSRSMPSSYKNSTNHYVKCDAMTTFAQYSIFIVPFCNAFASLLSFSLNCYVSSIRACRKCTKWTTTSEGIVVADPVDQDFNRGTNFWKHICPKWFSTPSMKHYALVAIASQWMLQALFSGALRLGEAERMNMTDILSEDKMCSVTASFPLDDCDVENMRDLLIGDRFAVSTPATSENWLQETSSQKKDMGEGVVEPTWPLTVNSSELLDVVSRVYGIVRGVINANDFDDRRQDVSQLVNGADDLLSNDEDFWSGNVSVDFSMNNEVRMARAIIPGNDTDLSISLLCMRNRCVVSTKFLKVHLFIFLFLVYFTPILVTTALLVISRYKCREITVSLELNQSTVNSSKGEIQLDENSSGAQHNTSRNFDKEKPTLSNWISDESKERKDDDDIVESKNNDSGELERMACELWSEAEKTRSFLEILKVNALMAVMMWTPFFFQVLMKVFLCSSVPGWLMETSFVTMILHAVFKNTLSLHAVRIEADAEKLKKRNSIHPS
ncbi:hypothetical protein QAD02_008497 [Eretmocerus hayati]|uniref:Uncharacterized protein n=1 Tax=Eretmocerus hayati TaxID=131215 RepID=A0ACC2N6L5_9HYME|nr:hypothetical protein QAD02_008497 [Eretmocerus hayati]